MANIFLKSEWISIWQSIKIPTWLYENHKDSNLLSFILNADDSKKIGKGYIQSIASKEKIKTQKIIFKMQRIHNKLIKHG